MSLFDKLKNKITEEKRKQRDNSYLFDDGKDSPKNNKKPKIETGTYNYSKNKNITSSPRVKATGDILQSGSKPTASQKKTAADVLNSVLGKTKDGNRFFTDKSDSDTLKTKSTGDEGQFKGKPKKFKITGDVSDRAPKVNQADVSKKAKEFTKKINKERIVKQKNIFGGEDTVKTKKKTSSLTSRGTRTKTPAVPGQKKLKLGTYTKGKVLPKQTLKPGGVIKTDLRTVPKKYPRGQRPKMSPAELKKVVKQASKPEKMVVAPDPVKGGFREVGATTKTGKNVLKTAISTDDLINPNSSKPQPKPKNLFGRIKGRIKGFYSNPEKSDFRTNRKSLDGSFSTTRNVYKGKTGAVKKFFDKMPRGNRRAALTIAAIAGAGMLAKRALSPTPKVEPKIYTTKKSKLTLKSTEDLGYRSKGAKKNKSLP